MATFSMNGYDWRVVSVPPYSPKLIDRTNKRRVATTDMSSRNVYISDRLDGAFRIRVLIHELGHCALYSFGLLYDIHKVVPKEYWIDAEEWCCNLIADYGLFIFRTAYRVLGNDAWVFIPKYLDDIFSA